MRQQVANSKAPGRVNLIGEHTDYNEGFTLPLAIERYTTIRVQRQAVESSVSRYFSQTLGQAAYWSMDASEFMAIDSTAANRAHESASSSKAMDAAPAWSKYVAGVINQFTKLGHSIPAIDLMIETNVPLGGGVSSSAALEVAVAMAMQKLLGTSLDGLAIAKLCQQAEHEYAGVPCGLMDQLSSVFGRTNELMLMDCRTNALEFIPASPQLAFIVINSRVKHNLADGEYRLRRQQCEEACDLLDVRSLRDVTESQLESAQVKMPDLIYRRARHVVTENERTVQAAKFLRSGNWEQVGQLMNASHISMRDDYEITCPEIDLLVTIAQAIGSDGGVYGARMTGGGFGGCIVILGKASLAESISSQVVGSYLGATGIQADAFSTRPAAGAWQCNSWQ
ncbi:MAG: galactokinase [Planctomycetaceae bacterium]|nr:galactokinase [Planctomycetaceae bacterium]